MTNHLDVVDLMAENAKLREQLVSAKDALQEIFDLEMGRGDGVVGDYIDEVRQIARVALTDDLVKP